MLSVGRNDGVYPGRVQSDSIAAVTLVATVEQHFTAPAGSSVAVFASTGNFYCLTNGQTAAAPTTNTAFPSPNTVAELNPTVLAVTGGTTVISLVSAGTPTITISFYKDVTQTLANG